MKRDQSLEARGRSSSNFSLWYIVGGAVLVLAAVGVIKTIPDIQRYLRIRAM
jgi:hypothetical protein